MSTLTSRAIAAVAAAALAISACGSDDSATPAASTITEAQTTTGLPTPTERGAPPTTAGPEGTNEPPATDGESAESGDDPESGLRLVAIGDSIPYNSSEDCPGCTGFVDRYADALGAATGQPVETDNKSQHNGLNLPMLMDELPTLEADLREADAIIVGIAHNSIALNEDHPCGSNWVDDSNTFDDWSKLTAECAADSAESHRATFEELFSTIAGWRAGEPTVLLTVNRYSDWIGWTDANLSPEQEATTVTFLDAWNSMLCDAASSSGFTCVDIYHAFNGPEGSTPSGELLASDYTHPSDSGNELIARLLGEAGFAPLA